MKLRGSDGDGTCGGDVKGKVVVLTGGTAGLGHAAAFVLAQAGARVVVTGRNPQSGEAAVTVLRAVSANPDVELALGDLSTQAGVRSLAASIRQRFLRVDVLLNNVSHMPSERTLTEDGLEQGFAVNVVAPFLLTHELLEPLRQSPSPRVITLTGGEHPSRVDFDNLQGEQTFEPAALYSHHKLVMMAGMLELSRRLCGVNVNVCCPYLAATRGIAFSALPWLMRPLYPILRWMTPVDRRKSMRNASRASVFLASSPQLEGKTGLYFAADCKPRPWPAAALDESVGVRVLTEVERLSGAAFGS